VSLLLIDSVVAFVSSIFTLVYCCVFVVLPFLGEQRFTYLGVRSGVRGLLQLVTVTVQAGLRLVSWGRCPGEGK